MKSYIGWRGYGSRNQWSKEHVEDIEVWCPTVKNGNFCVMVNGKTMWTGNSQQAIELSAGEFRRVHRNEWVGSTERFSEGMWWDDCYENLPPLTKDENVILGVDAAVSGDCFAVVGITKHPTSKKKYAVRLCKTWKPPKNGKLIFKHHEPDVNRNLPDGYITEVCKKYKVKLIVYDAYQLHSMATEHNLERKSAFWESFSQGGKRLEADSALLQAIKQEEIAHPGFPDLTQHINNADAQKDVKNDNRLRLVKATKSKKIDSAVALSMELHRAKSLNL
jgi:phage terminase large subunit-like protein